MSSIISVNKLGTGKDYLVCKGAPESVGQLIKNKPE